MPIDPNEFYTAKLNGHVALRILLSKKQKTGIVSQPGTNRPRPSEQLWQRRRPEDELLTSHTSKHIRFFDLGFWLVDGEYEDNPFTFVPVFDTSSGVLVIPPAVASDIVPLTSSILAIADADREAKFFRIPKGDAGAEKCIQVNYTDDTLGPVSDTLNHLGKWTTTGLNLSSPEVATLTLSANSLLFASDINFSTAHITSTPVFTDPSVPFVPTRVMDIYLMPQLVYNDVEVDYVSSGTPHTEERNANYNVIPRSLADEYFAIDFFGSDYSIFWGYTNIIKQLGPARALDEAGTYPSIVFTYIDPLLSPNAAHFPEFGSPDGTFGNNFIFIGPSLFHLRAIVKQAGSWFYIWS